MNRTLMFVPVHSEKMMHQAVASRADRVIFDLEDSVLPEVKNVARELLHDMLPQCAPGDGRYIVRINSLQGQCWKEDVLSVLTGGLTVMLPKTESADDVRALAAFLTAVEAERHILVPTPVIALVETAAGVENAREIACADPRMQGLLLGAEDLTCDIGCTRTAEGEEIFYARMRVLYAARIAGILAFDTPFTDIKDMGGLVQEASKARAYGFDGKALIHPGQIDSVNGIFSPTNSEIVYAQEVLRASEEAAKERKGAIALRGKMIDIPVIQRAKQVIALNQKINRGEKDE